MKQYYILYYPSDEMPDDVKIQIRKLMDDWCIEHNTSFYFFDTTDRDNIEYDKICNFLKEQGVKECYILFDW